MTDRNQEGKTCNKCLELKPITEFHIRSSGKYVGYIYARCKVCARADERQPSRKAHKAAYNKVYDQLTSERKKELGRAWRAANPQLLVAYTNEYRARKRANGGKYTVDDWISLVSSFGNKCLCCGRDDVPLSVDHVIPISKGGVNTIDNLQPLCLPCNQRKGAKSTDHRNATAQSTRELPQVYAFAA